MTSPTLPHRPAVRWALIVAAVISVALAWLKPLDQGAEVHIKDGLKRALATYAVARTINAVVSVAQETGISVSPAGVGMSFAPGQLLDPINDLVEQASSVMLAVSVSFGIQLLLLHLGGSVLVSAALTGAMLAIAARLWSGTPVPRWAWRMLAALLFVRFAVPLAASGSELSYQYAMASEYESSQAQIESTQAAVRMESQEGQANAVSAGSVASQFSRFWDYVRNAAPKGDEQKDNARERGRIEQLSAMLNAAVEHLVRLIAIFVVQTVLLPLVFVGLLGRLLSSILVPRSS